MSNNSAKNKPQLAKPDIIRQLSIQQENAIDLLIQGKSDREVSEVVGVSRQTVTEWRNHNVFFIAELNRNRQDIWGSQKERLRQLVTLAVDVLEENIQQTEDPQLRQKAAVHILRTAGLYGGSLEPTQAIEPEDVEINIQSAESRREFLKMAL